MAPPRLSSGGRLVGLTAALGCECPVTPHEAAMLIEALLRKHGLRAKAPIAGHAAKPVPMPVALPVAGAQISMPRPGRRARRSTERGREAR